MPDGLYYISGAGFAFGSNHGCPLTNAPQGFTEVTAAADKGNLEVMLPDVVAFIRRGKYLGFIYKVYTKSL
ncbi:unnamed protein product [marine sediment metagenome]|uniref:Uncharacterized protein n=1 Tax=marine sediment metagenome TaxID=412755 RepID=X0TE15_9ZZZZ